MTDLIPISDEQAKAVQEGFKLASTSIEAARAFGGYFARILGTLPEDLVGLLGGDWVRVRRVENANKMAHAAYDRLSARKVEPEPASLSVALPLLEAAADESRDELVDLWGRLLAAALDPNRAKGFRQVFIVTVKAMDPVDALVFSKIKDISVQSLHSPVQFFADNLKLSFDDVEFSLLRLIQIGCLREPTIGANMPVIGVSRIEITPLGRELLKAIRD